MNPSTKVGTVDHQLQQLEPAPFDACNCIRTLPSADGNGVTSLTDIRLFLFGVSKILDMRTLTYTIIFLLWFIKVLKIFLVPFSGSGSLETFIWPLIYLFVLGRDRFFTVYIRFKEILFFIFQRNYLTKISPYHQALTELRCQ